MNKYEFYPCNESSFTRQKSYFFLNLSWCKCSMSLKHFQCLFWYTLKKICMPVSPRKMTLIERWKNTIIYIMALYFLSNILQLWEALRLSLLANYVMFCNFKKWIHLTVFIFFDISSSNFQQCVWLACKNLKPYILWKIWSILKL